MDTLFMGNFLVAMRAEGLARRAKYVLRMNCLLFARFVAALNDTKYLFHDHTTPHMRCPFNRAVGYDAKAAYCSCPLTPYRWDVRSTFFNV